MATHAYSYGPFGGPQGGSGSTGQPLRFAARELDTTAGLYYVRARWYDASMGRFISEDPIGLAGGINNYAYALNDPVNLSDPTGLSPCPGPACLEAVMVVARARRRKPFWYSGFFTGAGDGLPSLGDQASVWAGVFFGGGADNGSNQNCPNTTPKERELARAADLRSAVSGTEEGYFISWGGLFHRSIDGPGVVKTRNSISARAPFWATTQIHNHPSGRGISEADSIYAYTQGVRVVTGSARTNVFGAINPGGARSTCITPN